MTHPAGCFTQFINFFNIHIFSLWKFALLGKRILFFSPPPIGSVCYRGEIFSGTKTSKKVFSLPKQKCSINVYWHGYTTHTHTCMPMCAHAPPLTYDLAPSYLFHLHAHLCPSFPSLSTSHLSLVCPCVCPSVRPSVRPSVCLSHTPTHTV